MTSPTDEPNLARSLELEKLETDDEISTDSLDSEADELLDESEIVPADIESNELDPKPRFQIPKNIQIGIGVLSIVVVAVIYLLRINPVAGLFVDDGWYIVLAKAIARGNGYTLINSPTPGILPLYPPGFPFLLSLVFLIFPSFPENVWALKMVSVLAVFGTGVISYLYFHQLRGLPKPYHG